MDTILVGYEMRTEKWESVEDRGWDQNTLYESERIKKKLYKIIKPENFTMLNMGS